MVQEKVQEPAAEIPGLEAGAQEEETPVEAAPSQEEEITDEKQTEPEEQEPDEIAAFFETVKDDDEKWSRVLSTLDEEAANRAQKITETIYEPALKQGREMVQQAQAERAATDEAMRQISDGVGKLTSRINKLLSTGDLSSETLSEALNEVPLAWKALSAVREEEKARLVRDERERARLDFAPQIADYFIRKGAARVGKSHLIQKFAEQLSDYKQGKVSDDQVAGDFAQAVFDAGYETGIKKGKTMSTEASNAADRKNSPTHAKGAAGGSNRPTPAQYSAASAEQRAKWREAGIEPLVE